MTARKIKLFKLQSCQISEAGQDKSGNSELPWNTGKNSREFSAIPTKQMPSRLGSKGWDTSPGFWPQWSLTITNKTFSKTILLFLQSTPAILLAISTQNSPGSQSSHIKESKWILLESLWMKLLKYFYYFNDKQDLYGQKTGQLQIEYSTNLPVRSALHFPYQTAASHTVLHNYNSVAEKLLPTDKIFEPPDHKNLPRITAYTHHIRMLHTLH